jgi:hypothetical protein
VQTWQISGYGTTAGSVNIKQRRWNLTAGKKADQRYALKYGVVAFHSLGEIAQLLHQYRMFCPQNSYSAAKCSYGGGSSSSSSCSSIISVVVVAAAAAVLYQ